MRKRWTNVLARLKRESPSYRCKWPLSQNVLTVTTHYSGGLLWWEESAELAGNMAIFLMTELVALFVHPNFCVIWTLVGMLGLVLFFDKLRFTFFERRPARDVTSYEGAVVPQELIDRYDRAFEEYNSVVRELNALPPTGESLEVSNYA